MIIDFNNIDLHKIPMADFQLKWRFIEENHKVLPDIHLDQLTPLDKQASKYLNTYLTDNGIHTDFPFKKDFFQTVDSIKIVDDNKTEIKKWLYHRGLPFDKKVFLSWDNENAIITTWKMLVKYFDSFYYGGADDLTIFDESLQWSLVFFHEDIVYFGTNKDFVISDKFEDI